jgi:uncharacterized protein (UPF0276 family)
MKVAMPRAPRHRQLGVGLDLSWGKGFVFDPSRGDVAGPGVVRFLEHHARDFKHLFVSFQPRDRSELDARDYFPAYDDLFHGIGAHYPIRGLHHTALNLGAIERYDRGALLELTCALVERYDFAWVNEDVGLWSIHGKPLPYPLPPYFTQAGLEATIRNTCEVQAVLPVPLLVEFPGFSAECSLVVGRMHAYDFMRVLAEEADVAVTLDTGHLLSYQWLRGRRGAALLGDLERLPLDRCFEIHLSGCEIAGEEFLDRHHGVLLDAQLELLERLVRLCPNVRAVTYEDPIFDEAGAMASTGVGSFRALCRAAAGWS